MGEQPARDPKPKRGRPPEMPRRPKPGTLLLTIPEVMYLTGYSSRQLRKFIKVGWLKNSSAEHIIRIRLGDVCRLIDGKLPREQPPQEGKHAD